MVTEVTWRGEKGRKLVFWGYDLTKRKDLTYNEHIPYLQIVLLKPLPLK